MMKTSRQNNDKNNHHHHYHHHHHHQSYNFFLKKKHVWKRVYIPYHYENWEPQPGTQPGGAVAFQCQRSFPQRWQGLPGSCGNVLLLGCVAYSLILCRLMTRSKKYTFLYGNILYWNIDQHIYMRNLESNRTVDSTWRLAQVGGGCHWSGTFGNPRFDDFQVGEALRCSRIYT